MRILGLGLAATCLIGCVHGDEPDLYAYESARIDAERANELAARVRAEAADGDIPLAKLVETRRLVIEKRLPRDVVEDIQAAVERAVDKRMTSDVEPYVAKERWAEALQVSADLASYTRADSPARARVERIRKSGADAFAARLATADSPGRRLLYARLAEAFRGPPVTPAIIDAAQAPVAIAWTFDVGDVRCGDGANRIRSAFPSRTGGALGSMKVDLRCDSSKRAHQVSESFTYQTREQYIDREAVTSDVVVTGPGSRECHQESVTATTRLSSRDDRTEIRTVCEQGTSTHTEQQTTYRNVTKTELVEHTGHRMVDRIEATTRTAGSAHIVVGDDAASGDLATSVSRDGTVQSAADNVAASEKAAIDAAIVKIGLLIGDAQEKRARPLLRAGDDALRAGNLEAAEESYMLAYLTTHKVAPAFATHLRDAYGVTPAAIGGGIDVRVGEPLDLATKDTPSAPEEKPDDGQRGGRGGAEVAYGAMLTQSTDLAPQGNRAILGGYMHVRHGVISAAFDSSWGFGLYDYFEAQGFVGARTTTGFRATNGDEERNWGVGGGAAYRAMLGYRATRFGVFAGVEPRFMLQLLAGAEQTGFFVPVVARLEYRIAGPAVIAAEAWMSPTTSGTHTTGADVVLPLGRRWLALRFSAEKRFLHTELPVAAGGDGTESVGIRETVLATGSLVGTY